MTRIQWAPGPARPELAPATVDVWCAQLGGDALDALLSPHERTRAARFARPEHGRRWASARAALRALLGAYADADPRALRLDAGPHGKPQLAGDGELRDAELRFNLSHAGDVALIAVARGREVGVDVELPRAREVEHVLIARRILGDDEADRLAALDPAAREQAFLRAWVRWEARLKCLGTGIAGADRPPDGPEPWLLDLDLGEPAAGALAVEDGPCAVRCWSWPPVAG